VGSSDQHRSVGIVSTRVHGTIHFRGEFEACVLGHGESVHVAAQQDGGPVTIVEISSDGAGRGAGGYSSRRRSTSRGVRSWYMGPNAILAAVVDSDEDGTRLVDGCELCEAARFTHWYYEDDVCWVADCEACSTPMVVWKRHGTEPSESDVAWMMARLTESGDARFGAGAATIDRTMRQIPEHFHAHVRDRDWFNRRWSEKISRYTGVGSERETAK
jgi:hypothetical protein